MTNQDPYPCITVATVTYNAAQTLPRTLASVAAQTYPNIEHLIVDGCSKDQTLELVHQYVDRNTHELVPHRIRLISEPDKGLYDAMNKVIRNAEGDYVCFLNAGDCFHSADTLQELMHQLKWEEMQPERYPAVLYGETDLVDADGRFLRHRRLQVPDKLTSRSFLQGMLVCHQSFYVRTDLARQELYDLRYRFSADFDWCIRIMKRAQALKLKMHHSHLILTDYLSEGLTTQNHRKSLLERLRIMDRHYGWPLALWQHAWFVLRSVIKK